MKRGFFISMEGPDGSGKSTQIQFLQHYLEEKNIDVVVTREPGGTTISEKIRSIILDNNHKEMHPMTETLLYAAARAQHVAEVILPALEEGKCVICDRFVDSSIAYQGYGRNLGECVSIINDYATFGNLPDITFLFKVEPIVGKNRIKEEEFDRLEQENIDFHNAVFNGYLELESKFSNRIIGIDASLGIEGVSKEIKETVDRRLAMWAEEN